MRRLGASIIVRVSEELREALEVAAAEDDRTASNYARKALSDHLKQAGYLKASAKKRPRKRR